MRRWDPLSERQATLLRRIGDGDDLSGADGVAQRTSARSLQNRGLVEVSRRNGSWRATVTDAGRFYLDHGHHPEDPDRRPPDAEQPPAPPPKRPLQAGSRQPTSKASGADSAAAGPLVEQARELIAEVRRDGGTLRLEAPDADTRARYRRMIHAAKQYNLVPEGFHLKHTGRASGDLIIRLSDDAAPDETDWNRVRLNTRRVTTDPSLVFAALEKDPAGLDVTEASVARALELIRSLAEEARRRGHRVGVNIKTKHPKVYLQLGQTRRSLTVARGVRRCPARAHGPGTSSPAAQPLAVAPEGGQGPVGPAPTGDRPRRLEHAGQLDRQQAQPVGEAAYADPSRRRGRSRRRRRSGRVRAPGP